MVKEPVSTEPSSNGGRRHDLDALRVVATFLLIIFHTARAFDHEPWHIKNDVMTQGMDILVGFIHNWHMPLFFLLAGSGIYYSLRRRSATRFVKERVQRLLIPFLAGILLIIPPQIYIERIGRSAARQSPINFDGSFLEFYPTFFTRGVYPDGNFSWHHLWFIVYLFVLSTLLLPAFLYLRNRGQHHVERWSHVLSKGRRIFLMALPLIVLRVALIGLFPGPQNFVGDVTNLLTSGTLLLYGYLLVASPHMQQAVDRNRYIALMLAVIATGVIGMTLVATGWPEAYTGLYFILHPAWSLCTWAWLVTFLGFGHRLLNVDRRWVRVGSELGLPFYIVHQTVIVVVGHYILALPYGVLAKFVIIAAGSLILSWLLSVAIGWSNVTRFLFGVKLRHDTSRSSRRVSA